MALPKRYKAGTVEAEMQTYWQDSGVYHFDCRTDQVYSVDTPPPTVSGNLHLGHIYSYSQPDFMVRFWRMKGYNVFYPMGFDDNGLATERLVERRQGITARMVGREAFARACLQISEEVGKEYRNLWERLGLSIDWRHTYRTIDQRSQRAAQISFLDLYHKNLVYRRKAPTIWCPTCQTAIAQAELDDLDQESVFITLAFHLDEGERLPIATTRPELLAACVAIFVHPEDLRYRHLVGRSACVPIYGQQVPIIEDVKADPDKGSGAVMCCTFGDVTDVAWWHIHALPLVQAISRDGSMTEEAGVLEGLTVSDARCQIIDQLQEAGLVLDRQAITHSVRVHERCDTPAEFTVSSQWFIRVLDHKEDLLEAGESIQWHPEYMKTRYRAWVENLGWDWCISRQRHSGVPFPVWYCRACGSVTVADNKQVPIDPAALDPAKMCRCGSSEFIPEMDVMDTWATSSLTPQIVGGWLDDDDLYQAVSPFSLRVQAHEIIRTWAFYTIVKSYHHFGTLPWKEIAISGWGLAPEGGGKISKSRGGGPMPPLEMLEKYSADAVRYWAALTGFGKDSIISEEKIQVGARLANKLWNVARFSQRFLLDYDQPAQIPSLSPADRWLLSRLQRLIDHATVAFERYDYASAIKETESFFWGELADNYLEMAKKRLYDDEHPGRAGALFTLEHALSTVLKLFAPFIPHVTERVNQALFTDGVKPTSIHRAAWPKADQSLMDDRAETVGELIKTVATAVRRFKSEYNLSLGSELSQLQLCMEDAELAQLVELASDDISSITRAVAIDITRECDPNLHVIYAENTTSVAIAL